jgi:hypothetical protein
MLSAAMRFQYKLMQIILFAILVSLRKKYGKCPSISIAGAGETVLRGMGKVNIL